MRTARVGRAVCGVFLLLATTAGAQPAPGDAMIDRYLAAKTAELGRRFLDGATTLKDWEGKRDHVEIFALQLDRRPEIRIDHREVVSADWFSPEQALKLELFPPIRAILDKKLRAERAS